MGCCCNHTIFKQCSLVAMRCENSRLRCSLCGAPSAALAVLCCPWLLLPSRLKPLLSLWRDELSFMSSHCASQASHRSVPWARTENAYQGNAADSRMCASVIAGVTLQSAHGFGMAAYACTANLCIKMHISVYSISAVLVCEAIRKQQAEKICISQHICACAGDVRAHLCCSGQ